MGEQRGQPKIPRYKPYYAELRKGKRVFWCACGRSNNQPFCDGSHKGTGFEPVPYAPSEEKEEVLFCGCKQTATPPFCDGSHNNLLDEYDTDDPDSEANRAISAVPRAADGRTRLDGACFVADMDKLNRHRQANMEYATVISRDAGARYQSQFFFQLGDAPSPIITFGDHDVLLFFAAGYADLTISGVTFAVGPLSGAYVRPGEAFTISPQNPSGAKIYASVCPCAERPTWLDHMPDNFDQAAPQRVIGFDEESRTSMADRFFQVLINKDLGCTRATLFIGEIPFSKAAVHRHLYEESLIIVRGSGCMWTRSAKTPVGEGDVIFLPRKEAHSLQCTDVDGMLVAGVIYPGDNPSINY